MSIILKQEESTQEFKLTLKKPTLRYFDHFIRLKCASDLLNLEVFPNAKEITESMAAFHAIRKYLKPPAFGENFILLDVGSGAKPRTGALFAFMTRWRVYAIDPLLKKPHRWSVRVERLEGIKSRIEYVTRMFEADTIIATCVHSHAPLQPILDCTKCRRLIIIAMPCCEPLELKDIKPIKEYEDWGIHSPQRTIKIYNIIREEK